MVNVFEEKVKVAINRFHKRYIDEFQKKISSFISLAIENQCDLSLYDENECKEITVENLLQEMIFSEKNRVSLLGGPGAGKSTLLLRMAILLCNADVNNHQYIPVLIKCGLEKQLEIKRLVHLGGFDDNDRERLWTEGRLFLIFDGINELSNIEVRDFMNNLTALSDEYPDCKFIISCRTLEYPVFEYSPFEKYTVSPVTESQIEEKLVSELGEEKGRYYYSELCHSPKNYLLDICRTPLLLSLIIGILCNTEENVSFEMLKNKSDIYKNFYESITIHQRKKSSASSKDKYYSLRDEIFKQLSFYMQAKGIVYIDEKELTNFIRNAKYVQDRSLDIIKDLQNKEDGHSWYWKVADELKKSGFFNVYNELEKNAYTYAFIHQSFQEYFAGCFLCEPERITETKYNTFLLQNGNSVVTINSLKNPKRNWATIEFASNQDSTSRLISYTMRYAEKKEDPNALELAANCIIQDATSNKDLVNDCCIWLLEAFKYWSIPYKYNLIYAANRLLPYVSYSFPKRIKKDIQYFSKKYTGGYLPIEYPESFDFEYLKGIILNNNIERRLNAIFTIGERIWPENKYSFILSYLFSLLSSAEDIIREQAVKAIKGTIEHNKGIALTEEQFHILIEIIKNKSETGAIRTYTLNTIAETGDTRAIPIFMDYLQDKENPYRDSASWSLQELILKNSESEYSIDEIRAFYFDCLISESNDENGMYSKGNLVYTLSKLSAVSYIDKLKKWIVKEEEPYVQEDGINAICVLADSDAVAFIEPYTNSPDPVIRSKALRGLLEIDRDTYLEKKESIIKNDQYSIVRDILDDETFSVTESIEELLSINPKNNRIVEQNYENVNAVFNYTR